MPTSSEKLLLGKREGPTLYTWFHANHTTIEIPAE
jgi:hypothetical protein